MSFDLSVYGTREFPDEKRWRQCAFLTLSTRIENGLCDALFLVKDGPRFVPDQGDEIYYFDTGIWSVEDFRKLAQREPESQLYQELSESFKELPSDVRYLYFQVSG